MLAVYVDSRNIVVSFERALLCLFCPNLADSREHLWSSWMNEVLPTKAPGSTTYTLDREGEDSKSWLSPKPATHTVKVVCETCNTGWMSKIEARAKPIMVPLLRGEERELHKADQEALAAWAYLKTVIAEHLNPRTATIPELHRRWLHDHVLPPTGVFVFVAAAELEKHSDTFYLNKKLRIDHGPPLPPEESNGYVATMAIGQLVLQIGGTLFEKVEMVHQAPFDKLVNRIWPFQKAISWPGIFLAPRQLGELADHWRGISPPSPPTIV